MSILTEFFIATPDKVNAKVLDHSPSNSFPCVEYKNVDTIKLSTLVQLGMGSSYEQADSKIMGGAVPGVDKGPWAFRIPDEYTEWLSSLTQDVAQDVSGKWVKTEEWEADGATDADVPEFTDMILDIGRLAKQAIEKKCSMYLWVSL